ALHTPNEEFSQTDFFLFKKEALIIIVICFIVLFVAILLSWWHGYRYGKPLLLFMGWLDRLGKGQYEELLTEKEQKKVFRKNGKIRIRYRLYNEVFQSFYMMTEKLTAAEEERNRLEKTREEWMTGISHDLRTPLSTIQGYAHMLESNQYEFSKEELAEIGKVMREKGDYMLNLVNDFTLVFKLKNSTISLETVATEVNEFVQQIVEKFTKDMTMKQANFSFSGTENELHLPIDPNWFERVLDNLINNAVKHNKASTNIQVGVELEQNNVVISINDDGIGMDEATVANLFERYYRGTSTNERTEGAGLGMSIAKAIVELHGGSITVHSQEGEGTSIRLRFPLEK
ncbi:MAG TPA: HAMP domain-containing histidine kinase, partial [Bacilli bacterium]|nr:HAMP domain-containing histidine kinase [Bacilli bacterium]